MIKMVVFLFLTGTLVNSSVRAENCDYWTSQVNPLVEFDGGEKEDPPTDDDLMAGIGCLLTQEGIQGNGLITGSKPEVSQHVPRASVEVSALYLITELFYGNDDFADAVALISTTNSSNLRFNSKQTIKRAYKKYRKWYSKVKKVGLTEARKRELDPLRNSGVRWY